MADPELKRDRILKKIEKGKIQGDPVNPARSSQKFSCNSLTFIFFTKMMSF
jgi:hypothetical protein